MWQTHEKFILAGGKRERGREERKYHCPVRGVTSGTEPWLLPLLDIICNTSRGLKGFMYESMCGNC